MTCASSRRRERKESQQKEEQDETKIQSSTMTQEEATALLLFLGTSTSARSKITAYLEFRSTVQTKRWISIGLFEMTIKKALLLEKQLVLPIGVDSNIQVEQMSKRGKKRKIQEYFALLVISGILKNVAPAGCCDTDHAKAICYFVDAENEEPFSAVRLILRMLDWGHRLLQIAACETIGAILLASRNNNIYQEALIETNALDKILHTMLLYRVTHSDYTLTVLQVLATAVSASVPLALSYCSETSFLQQLFRLFPVAEAAAGYCSDLLKVPDQVTHTFKFLVVVMLNPLLQRSVGEFLLSRMKVLRLWCTTSACSNSIYCILRILELPDQKMKKKSAMLAILSKDTAKTFEQAAVLKTYDGYDGEYKRRVFPIFGSCIMSNTLSQDVDSSSLEDRNNEKWHKLIVAYYANRVGLDLNTPLSSICHKYSLLYNPTAESMAALFDVAMKIELKKRKVKDNNSANCDEGAAAGGSQSLLCSSTTTNENQNQRSLVSA